MNLLLVALFLVTAVPGWALLFTVWLFGWPGYGSRPNLLRRRRSRTVTGRGAPEP